MTATSNRTKKLGIACPTTCQFHPETIGWDAANKLMASRERGAGSLVWIRVAEDVLQRKISASAPGRHFKHYVEAEVEGVEAPKGPKPGDIEILDSIILQGFRNSKNWKPTIRDTLEAMKLKTAMTGNSAFEDLISLFDDDFDGTELSDDEILPENPDAVLSVDERPDDHDSDLEDLPEPLAGS